MFSFKLKENCQVQNKTNCFLSHFGVGCTIITLRHFNVFLPRTLLYNPQSAKSGIQLWDLVVIQPHQLSQRLS